ncbi:DUF559 domain-containing protein [Paenibacillus glycanilyticus]|uniref:DUF559 domain-containing protein n=1 Tax=Paenibacillus glycanilyticus TaxID=126569 RepID=A0ABQ6GDB3_9BACL|nr:DUF559 domain-containing protein [Paenibacillus glycanilyticus]GLX67622.1 hypothetical protein MU1_19670 [Paenibacillus glycanilyticus]
MRYELVRYIESFEHEAAVNGHYRGKLGKMELMFLEQVWGPAFQFQYEGLKAEHPFRDFKGGQRFVDFVYVRNGVRLAIEIDGFTTHARDLTPGEFNDHLERQNDLILSGWLVLRFSAWQVEHQAERCQRTIMQAIGYWWSRNYGVDSGNQNQLHEIKKSLIMQIALRHDGKVKPDDVARQFQVTSRTAVNWLHKLRDEGILECDSTAKRVSVYRLANYIP